MLQTNHKRHAMIVSLYLPMSGLYVQQYSKYELLCSLGECQFVCLVCYARTNLNNTIYTWRNTRSDDLLLVFLRVGTITPSCFLMNPLGPRVRLASSVIVGVFRRFLQQVNKDTTLIYHTSPTPPKHLHMLNFT